MEVTLQKSQTLNKVHRESLYPLFEQVFGIPSHMLQDYYDRGFWDPRYGPYTIFKENRAIANVSVIPMSWIIDGEPVTAAGIQSVMTLPSERGKGYMKKLMNLVLEDLTNHYSFIFLQTEIPALYEKYGFKKVEEHIFVTEAFQNRSIRNSSLKKLDFLKKRDAEIIQSCFTRQHSNSYVFSPLNYEHSLYLNLYNPFFSEKMFYSESLDLLLVYEIRDQVLKLYDVVAKNSVNLCEICSVVPEVFKKVEMHFTPDQMTQMKDLQTLKKDGTLMVKGKLPIAGHPIAFPITASF
ncbi:GNAT family N-acetyltransferase [Fictibacillus sp. NPDC058756]|uniref:GNAT family N-acetyltransferase n=1 Tax=Fictibacillus sp. NPDC058756 TaxID=3346625 RepID=UPI0036AE3F55